MDLLHDLNKKYNKQNYLDRYGSSVVSSILIFIVFFTLTSYFVVLNNVQPIRADWLNQRCKPSVIPFAGIINPPNDGTSPFDYTQRNYNECMQNILKETASNALAPLHAVIGMLHKFIMSIMKAINAIRKLFDKVRTGSEKIMVNILHRILGILIPVQEMMIAMKDLLLKSKGLMTASLFTALGGYMSIKSAIGAIYELIIAILVALGAMIVLLWILPFTWSTAALATTAMIAISIPTGILATFMGDVFNQASSPVPAPSCFAGDTELEVCNLGKIKIKDIVLGSKLVHDGYITAIFKLSSKHEKMYNLNGVIVSGSHCVLHNNQWIKVKYHPLATLVKNFNENIIYCLNTTKKQITINDVIFRDWDDKSEAEMIALNNHFTKYGMSNIKKNNMHDLNFGFCKNTLIELSDRSLIPISKIRVGEKLKNNEQVLGIVEIWTDQMCYYKLEDGTILGSNRDNINIRFPYAEKLKSHFEHKVYHLLTNTKSFFIKNQHYDDFENSLDNLLYK